MKKTENLIIKRLNVFLSLLILLLLISCKINTSTESEKQDETTNNFNMDSLSVDELYELIIGMWDWDYSIHMSRTMPPPITPDSLGYTLQRKFKPNKHVDNYKNNLYTDTQSYYINRFKILETDIGEVTVIYIDSVSYELYFLHPDTLMIGNGWLDGIDNYYVRID